jgi:hypothetical protein
MGDLQYVMKRILRCEDLQAELSGVQASNFRWMMIQDSRQRKQLDGLLSQKVANSRASHRLTWTILPLS